MKVRICESASNNIYYNLSAEEWLMRKVGKEELIVFFYVNDPCVVLGANQNVETECNMSFIHDQHILLARRRSGGGCVYHDNGNLNYAFIGDPHLINEEIVYDLIISSLGRLGIKAKKVGRNDITVSRLKISGNAFISGEKNYFQHGTILIKTDLSMLESSLNVDHRKKMIYGISSCRQRVLNLTDINVELTPAKVISAIKEQVENKYGNIYEYKLPDTVLLKEFIEKYKSNDWIYGSAFAHTFYVDAEYSWGYTRTSLLIKNGIIANVAIDTDSMNERLSEAFKECVLGCEINELKDLHVQNNQIKDIIADITKAIQSDQV